MRAPRRRRPRTREIGPPPEQADLDELAERARYVGSPEHKDTASFAGPPRLRADASCCPREMAEDQPTINGWLRSAIRRGATGTPWETTWSILSMSGSPAWERHPSLFWEGRPQLLVRPNRVLSAGWSRSVAKSRRYPSTGGPIFSRDKPWPPPRLSSSWTPRLISPSARRGYTPPGPW